MTKTEKELEDLLKPVVTNLGYELYDVMFVKEGSDWFLRLFIDSENGIDLDDCEKVSNGVSDILDEKDPISMQYNLEVSSCGLERHLREIRHFEEAIGKAVEFKLYKAINNEKVLEGRIIKVENDEILIGDDEGNEFVLELSNISSAKILFNWEEL